jgi:hypothetical protein
MTKRADSYIFTADPKSCVDMMQIDTVRKTVRAINREAKTAHKYAVARAQYWGHPTPKAPTMKRVRVMGRGPRKEAAMNDYGRPRAYDAYLPQRYATSFDVYIGDAK